MRRRVTLVAAGILLLAWVGAARDTGLQDPSADAGEFAGGAHAYFDDDRYAEAGHGQEHRYWGYSLSVPQGSEILGIEVIVDARRTPGPPGARFEVELSWDGGLTWTAAGYATGELLPVWRRHVLGGPADLWGRPSWTTGELSPQTFRVRVRAQDGPKHLRWIAVRVFYEFGIPLTLSVAPETVDLGTVTLADYDAQHRELSPAQRVTVSSGAGWVLYIAADSATWAYTGPDPSPGKPCSHLEWKVEAAGPGVAGGQGSYMGLATANQRVASGSPGSSLWMDIAFRLHVDYTTTVPGSYELRYTYTLTSP